MTRKKDQPTFISSIILLAKIIPGRYVSLINERPFPLSLTLFEIWNDILHAKITGQEISELPHKRTEGGGYAAIKRIRSLLQDHLGLTKQLIEEMLPYCDGSCALNFCDRKIIWVYQSYEVYGGKVLDRTLVEEIVAAAKELGTFVPDQNPPSP